MQYKLNICDLNALCDLCKNHSFIQKGQNYYRIIGDGVLQVIKLQYERSFNHYSLNICLISLYSKHSKENFFKNSSFPQYSICCLIGQQTSVSYTEQNGISYFHIMSLHDQITLLAEKGFDWLDHINDQERLWKALFDLDTVSYKSVIWNDVQKIAPFLATENYIHADRVISSMLSQQLGPNTWAEPPWTEKDFTQYEHLYPTENRDLILIHQWIAENSIENIKTYLYNNYLKNKGMYNF